MRRMELYRFMDSKSQFKAVSQVKRRRSWSDADKIAIVRQISAPGMSVALVAERHSIAPNQLFTWRRRYSTLVKETADTHDLPAIGFELKSLQNQVRELHRLLGKKTLENEMLREALENSPPGRRLAKAITG